MMMNSSSQGPKQRGKKKILLLTIQPPGGSGVQSLIFNKLCPHLLKSEWDFHFAGPAPELTSVLCATTEYPRENLHYSRFISRSKYYSILKNRQNKGSAAHLFYSVLQLAFKLVERFTSHDSMAFLQKGLRMAAENAEAKFDFDVIAGKSPDFRILEMAAELADLHQKPLLAIFDDPHGQRDNEHFYPDDRERQLKVLNQASLVLFMSPKTRERYIECGLVPAAKCRTITDSYSCDPELYQSHQNNTYKAPAKTKTSDKAINTTLNIAHLGNLPEWRPIDTLLEALLHWQECNSATPLHVNQYGYLYAHAREQIKADSSLCQLVDLHAAISHKQSHLAAAEADILLVIIGARHLDNQPSKFFDYLGHGKPLLVLGPPGNPIESIIK